MTRAVDTRIVARAVTLAGVPLLLAEPRVNDGLRPTVLWFHGFRADALAHAAELERCADAGFLAVGIDAVGHGARRHEDMAERLEASADGLLSFVLGFVDATIDELPSLLTALHETYDADPARLSAVGVSMGALLVYGAIMAGLPLRAAVALLGSPEWPRVASPHRHPDAFAQVALLGLTAEHDVSVPPGPATAFHAELAERFGRARQVHHVLRGAGHLTNAAQWREAMDVTMAWLQRHGR
jgi:hypothetical protein